LFREFWITVLQATSTVNPNSKIMKRIYSLSFKIRLFILFTFVTGDNLLFAQLPNIGYSPLHSDGSFNGKSIDVNLPVGSTPGSGDAASGAASYTIPIAVPAGTAGVVPSLSVSYNSMGGNGIMGMGWGLSGMSSITRIGKNFFHDGEVRAADFSYQDRFALDGQRLLLKSGNYGENGANYGTESENHSNVTSFQANGDGNVTSFTVQTADGVIMNYGSNDNSRIKDGVNINTVTWLLDKVTYPNGNYIDYIYVTYDLETVISEIKYTGNSNTGLQPYNFIQFSYKNREDKNTYYQVGVTRKTNVLLDQISIISDGQLFKNYVFTYGLKTNISYSDGLDRSPISFLKEVFETATNGSGLAFNSTAFRYGDNNTGSTLTLSNILRKGSEGRTISSDFNSDGYSDIMYVKQDILSNGSKRDRYFEIYLKTPGANDNFTLSYTSPELTVQEYVYDGRSHTYRLSLSNSIDYNGDGFNDILTFSTQSTANNTISIKDIILFVNQKNGTFVKESLETPSTKTISAAGHAVFGGDFNGDGLQDILTTTYGAFFRISKTDGSYNPFFQATPITPTPSNETAGNWGYADIIEILDFNGDGKSDIMIISNNQCEIVTLEGNQYRQIYFSNSYLSKNYIINFGDFNGDGKVDILSRNSKTDNSVNWGIRYSSGKEFVTSNALSFTADNLSLLVGDYNADGKSDILEKTLTRNASDWQYESFTVRYSKGNELFTTPDYRNFFDPGYIQNFKAQAFNGDFNGDGTMDLVVPNGRDTYNEMRIIYVNKNLGSDNLLQKVKNGIGHVTEWQYKRLNDGSGFYNRTNTNKPFPLNTLMMPMLAVSSFRVSDGVGGMAIKDFNFENALFHVGGRGLLGFEKSIVSDSRADVKIVAENEMSSSKYLLLPKKTTTYKLSNNVTLSEATSSLQVVDVGNNRYRVQANSESQSNYFENKSSTTTNSYDGYGLVTGSNTRLYGGMNVFLTEETNTSTSYGQYGGRIPNKPTNVSISKTRYERSPNPDATFISSDNKTMSYDGYGQMTSKTDFAGRPQSVTTYYAYSNVGNITQTTISASGISNRTTSANYDGKGRFVTSSTNVLGQTSYSNYDAFGQVTSSTGIDNLTTIFSYDGFGRLTQTTLFAGTGNAHNITQEKYFTGNYGAVYANRILHPGKPNVTTYYDILGREVATETEGYNGKTIITTQSYTNRGQIASSTQPHYSAEMGGDAYLTTNNNYDSFNRLTSSSNELGTSYMSYNYDWDGKMTITTTDMGGRNSSKLMDATGKTVSSTDNGGTQRYSYNAQDKLLAVVKMDAPGSETVLNTSQYDDYGRQIQLNDMSAGTTSYQYNGIGELVGQTTPKGQTNMSYDNMGRITARSGPEGTTSTQYYGQDGGKTNQVRLVTGFSGESTEYDYDGYGRLTHTIQRIDGTDYHSFMSYDLYGNMTQKTFPSGLTIKYNYDGNGYVQFIRKNNDEVIFQNTDQNALGQVKSYNLGNGRGSSNTYNYGVPTNFSTGGIQNLSLDWNLQKGNLNRRTDYERGGKTENFEYDDLDRLTSTRLDNDDNKKVYMGFAPSGNITSKTDVGNYGYDANKKHSVTSVTNGSNVIPVFTQNITFSAYERPTTISENNYVLNYTYGADYERIKGVMTQNGNNVYTRYFVGDFERNIQNGVTKDIHYISSPAGLIAIVVRENGNDNYKYVYTDHLGSILTVTDNNGNIEARQSFDAWGRRRDVNSWVPMAPTASTGLPDWLYRGYTGHEHLDQFGIINMNARLYDPVVGRMISPDNFVNGAFGTQGYNRYSYANNNPLSYNDPTGNHPLLIIGAILLKGALISAGVNLATQVIQNGFNHINWGSVGVSAFAGAIGAGWGYVIGEAFAGATGYGSGLLQAGAHALSGGLQSVMFGGNFGQGAISGVIGTVAGNIGIRTGLSKNLVGAFVIGGVPAAITATIFGGDPLQAFITGGTVAAFNHYLHDKPKKTKQQQLVEYTKKLKINQGTTDYIEVGTDVTATSLEYGAVPLRRSFSLNQRINGQSFRISTISKMKFGGSLLGSANIAMTAYNTYDDISSYESGDISGLRLTYKLGSGAGALYVGAAYGGPPGMAVGVAGVGTEVLFDLVDHYWLQPLATFNTQLENAFKNGWFPVAR
jgi:RHS repeat-associated protein